MYGLKLRLLYFSKRSCIDSSGWEKGLYSMRVGSRQWNWNEYNSNEATIILRNPHPLYRWFNSLRPRQNRRHFADDVFKCNLLNENVWIPIKISLKFVPNGPINNIPALVQIMARRRTGDKPLSEPMMTQFNDAYMRHSASINKCKRNFIALA